MIHINHFILTYVIWMFQMMQMIDSLTLPLQQW